MPNISNFKFFSTSSGTTIDTHSPTSGSRIEVSLSREDLSMVVEMLYLYYKQNLITQALKLDDLPDPEVYSRARDLVDSNFIYYKGLSQLEFCNKFEELTHLTTE